VGGSPCSGTLKWGAAAGGKTVAYDRRVSSVRCTMYDVRHHVRVPAARLYFDLTCKKRDAPVVITGVRSDDG
jgi:hypothetical protein